MCDVLLARATGEVVCLSVCVCDVLSMCVYVCLPICMHVCMSVCLSAGGCGAVRGVLLARATGDVVCLSVCLSVYVMC